MGNNISADKYNQLTEKYKTENKNQLIKDVEFNIEKTIHNSVKQGETECVINLKPYEKKYNTNFSSCFTSNNKDTLINKWLEQYTQRNFCIDKRTIVDGDMYDWTIDSNLKFSWSNECLCRNSNDKIRIIHADYGL